MGHQEARSSFSINRLVGRRKSDRRTSGESSLEDPRLQDELTLVKTVNSEPESESLAVSARRDLLEQISAFLLRHCLDVTPRNLTIACMAMSGSDLTLAQKIGARENGGQIISQEWLDSVATQNDAAAREREQVERLMAALENSVATFETTTETARDATATYRGEMSDQIDQASRASSHGGKDEFLSISRSMLDTLQRIETRMQESHSETQQLKQRLNEARNEANSDHLTGLPNRRAFEREFEVAHAKAIADRAELFVAIADIDHFKQVNDTFGHDTGDRLLKAIAKILLKFASKDCFVARHGGEEFVLLLHTDTVEQAHAQLDSARRELASRKFVAKLQNRPIGKVTFSAGIADVLAYENPRDALAAADDALYASKENGRNQITIAPCPEEPC